MHASGGSIVLVEVHGEDYIPSMGDGEVTTLGVTNLSLDIQGSFFQGSRHDPSSCIVSESEATKWLGECCQVYLANLVESESKPKELSLIPVVA